MRRTKRRWKNRSDISINRGRHPRGQCWRWGHFLRPARRRRVEAKPTEGGTLMNAKSRRMGLAVALFGLLVLSGAWAEEAKPTDDGKAEAFKGKTFDLKEKGE